jgi:carbon-monoxide dehydrogenase medium subunit
VPPTPHYGKYLKLGRNRISDLSIVGVSVLGYPDKTTTSGYVFKIVIASVAPVPFVAIKAQEILSKNKITESTINDAAALAMDSVTPIDDVRGSAKYRKYMTRNLVKRAIDIVFSNLSK